MKRLLTALFALALAACGAAKPEDLTAYYAKPGGIAFTVQAAANGDAKVTAGDQGMIRKGGIDYLVMKDAKGSYAARVSDYLAVLDAGPGATAQQRPQPDYTASPDGAATVASLSGTTWRVHPTEVPSLPGVAAVVSDDPALAVLGAGVAMYAKLLIERNARSMGAPPGKMERAIMALYDKGAVLRFGNVFEIERVETKPIAAATFALPVVLELPALKARMGAR